MPDLAVLAPSPPGKLPVDTSLMQGINVYICTCKYTYTQYTHICIYRHTHNIDIALAAGHLPGDTSPQGMYIIHIDIYRHTHNIDIALAAGHLPRDTFPSACGPPAA